MSATKTHVAAPPGDIYWRHERCPHGGAKVLLLTVGNVCVVGQWYGELNQFFVAWSPMPKKGRPPSDIRQAPLWQRIKFAFRLVFKT